MNTSPTFIDANIFMYAAGRESSQRMPCQLLLKEIVDKGRQHLYCTNSEVLQEVLHRYSAIGVQEIGFAIFDSIIMLEIPILPVSAEDVVRARELQSEFLILSTRDAVHIGVMQGQGMTRVITYDKGFSSVPWIKRVEANAG